MTYVEFIKGRARNIFIDNNRISAVYIFFVCVKILYYSAVLSPNLVDAKNIFKYQASPPDGPVPSFVLNGAFQTHSALIEPNVVGCTSSRLANNKRLNFSDNLINFTTSLPAHYSAMTER